MRFLFIILILTLLSCEKRVYPTDGTDPTFAPYIEKYVKFKGKGLDYNISIIFADLPGVWLVSQTVGLCSIWSNGARQIKIDYDSWQRFSEMQRFQVISHEFGHCDLNRDHYDEKFSNGALKSIMYKYTFEPSEEDLPYYMNELFNPDKNVPLFKSGMDDEGEDECNHHPL